MGTPTPLWLMRGTSVCPNRWPRGPAGALGSGAMGCTSPAVGRPSGHLLTRLLLFLLQGSAPILVVMVILLNIGVAILFINFFI